MLLWDLERFTRSSVSPVAMSIIDLSSWLGSYGVWGALSFVVPNHTLECSAIHLTASCSVMKPLTTSVSPSGHRISTPQPDPGFFRATKDGRCSDILGICAYGGPVQASYPAAIKLTRCLFMESA
jgi:hypothetical protein